MKKKAKSPSCKFINRCDHRYMKFVDCMVDNNQPAEHCYLYILMEDRDKAKLKTVLKQDIKDYLDRGG